jgi:hypothetical protein
MRIPEGLMENTSAALSLFSFLASIAGIVAVIALYAFSYLAISSIDAAVTPQFDSAQAALLDASAAASSAVSSLSSADGAISSLSSAFLSYSNSTAKLSSSLSGIASLPLFSLDPGIGAAANDLSLASGQFRNASQSVSQMGLAAGEAAASARKIASDLEGASSKLSEAKRNFKSALSSTSLVALILCLCLLALFSSVAFLSLSVMLTHYPNLLKQARMAEGGKGTGEENANDESAQKKKAKQ